MTTYKSLSHLSACLCFSLKTTLRMRTRSPTSRTEFGTLNHKWTYSFAHSYLNLLQLFCMQNLAFSFILCCSVPSSGLLSPNGTSTARRKCLPNFKKNGEQTIESCLVELYAWTDGATYDFQSCLWESCNVLSMFRSVWLNLLPYHSP